MLSENIQQLTLCDVCGSSHVSQNNEGFLVCTDCGVQQTEINLSNESRYNYSESHKTFSILRSTKIGNKFERTQKFSKLEKIQQHSTRRYDTFVHKHAYMEILGICSRLHLPGSLAEESFLIFKKVWKKLPKRSMARNYEILSPVAIFRTAKMLENTLELKTIFKEIKCTPKKFRSVLISTYELFPIINSNNTILSGISRICEELDLPIDVKMRALDLFNANTVVLTSTTKNVAKSTAVAMATISLGLRKKIPISKIAKQSQTSTSAVCSRIFKVMKSRRILVDYRIKNLDKIIPDQFNKLISAHRTGILPKKVSLNILNKSDSLKNQILNENESSERIITFSNIQGIPRSTSIRYERIVFKKADKEIGKYCLEFNLPKNFHKQALGIFKRIWIKLPKKCGERNYEILVPVVVHRTAKMLHLNIKIRDILDRMNCSPKKFRSTLISTYKLFPIFNHDASILKGIGEICQKLHLPLEVKNRAVKIFKSNRSIISSTTTNVSKGTAISLAILSLGLRKEIPIALLAKKINTSCSAISSRIFKLLKQKNIDVPYKIRELDHIIPGLYKKITKRW